VGRLFVRICPYLPFNARVCVNQHEWLARQLQREGIFFRKVAVGAPANLSRSIAS
jgi:hypothetical protein